MPNIYAMSYKTSAPVEIFGPPWNENRRNNNNKTQEN